LENANHNSRSVLQRTKRPPPGSVMVNGASTAGTRSLSVAGIDLEVWEGGQGQPLLLLHPGDGFNPDAPHVAALAARHRVIAPSCPGFGRSALPKWMRTVDDLSYVYLDLLQALGKEPMPVVGLSFGGWIAAEMAVKCTGRIAGLCLVDTLGAKFSSDPTVREILDLFSYPQYEQAQWLFEAEDLRKPNYASLSDEAAVILARNHESFALFGWSPTLHSPRLAHRLHRIDVPVQVLWGSADRVVTPEYGRKWQAAIPGATFELIEGAGHYPQIERPELFAAAVERFTQSLGTRR
jgi:pimeloyl-ACP methyl ester carboxylesterase